jgi:hypothetical protein
MLDYEILDEIADQFIPNEQHKELHIVPREVWVTIMIELIDKGIVKNSYSDLMSWAKDWESILFRRASLLN